MAEITGFLDRQPKWVLFAAGLISVPVIGFLDFLTADISLLFLYLMPVALVSWYVGCWRGLLIAAASSLARFAAYRVFSNKPVLLYWNPAMDAGFMIVMALLFNVLRRVLDTVPRKD